MTIIIPKWVLAWLWIAFCLTAFASIPFIAQYLHLYGPDWLYEMRMDITGMRVEGRRIVEVVVNACNWPLLVMALVGMFICVLAAIFPWAFEGK